MIGKIKGTLTSIENSVGLIETSGGVSYELYLTSRLLSTVTVGHEVEVFTYLQVRDDAFVLFGFKEKDEHHFFKLLLTVPGVGPKTAFSVVSNTITSDLFTAVKENNIDYFTQVPGLGKKTAMKIILELSQKIKSEFKFDRVQLSDEDKIVIDALVALGYKTHEAKTLFQRLPNNLSIEDKIKHALKLTVQKK
ncbi:Holliday junction DNA helicase RuvA [Candidatus Roizmanbacteria bacterium RIFOXYB2_FULL_38_10]|uniref:Holliday junction branch migration complex subunit RuvA n=1 Tax=Candidatus Roizmanbacteria bacterium RIFOXYD1_FULL_38_12 TaxID=1802093 RepID=A0A1F7L0G8_9BACT|nr:MAG: Holliday junction DNA helicase RuvA [Candidatus Roizmanbacteria bacterium RIFOXYA2_FULL_38_14]OGK63619.1 MAG: Holliday junction DNA helicase RuvA [Candidatus Roizmanbacteria bacterium RIFOXYA1_FULL_37_12]OGK65465.1 MAG: Holliday junction DNA helicase RuvA [Candidatus Roizmanbacteria bacterium RIFOXYB1_FULL_40_23]OGK68250.1 MAG: Holliday junction DNA helicase RuvA [Candidatus Roizmanbacteria bacterium RIFOXYB2_FULL_38_10]OGK69870.1 MAG: Holliday junction DNA helicase RuvA [Candidatus Roi